MKITPRNKLIVASVLVVALILAASSRGASTAATARWALALVSLVGFGLWLRHSKRSSATNAPAPRLKVAARAGLSQRCSVALVEADGASYVIAFGDGFAEIRPTKPRRKRTRPSNKPALVHFKNLTGGAP